MEVDKVSFFKLINYKPHAKQCVIHDSEARYRMAACGVRFGKSWAAAFEALACLMYKNVRGWIIAPNYVLTEKVFREVIAAAVNHLPDLIERYSRSDKIIVFKNGSELECKSADNPISLAGEALDFVIFDEAPGCKEEIWTHYARERLTDRLGWAMFIGTPRGRNWYFNLFNKGNDPLEPEYESFHFTSYDNPYLHKSEIDKARTEIPDRAFRQEYLAEFLSEADAVFRNIREQIRDCLKPPVPGKYYVGGVDVAKYQDFNVVTIADYDTHEIVFYDRWNRTDWTITYDRISTAMKRYNNATFYLDSTGVGDPVWEALSKPPYNCNIKPFRFTNTSKQHLVDNLAWFFENQSLFIPPVDEVINELEVFEYETLPSGRQRFNAPAGYHDDVVCSLGLTCQALSRGGLVMGTLDLSKL